MPEIKFDANLVFCGRAIRAKPASTAIRKIRGMLVAHVNPGFHVAGAQTALTRPPHHALKCARTSAWRRPRRARASPPAPRMCADAATEAGELIAGFWAACSGGQFTRVLPLFAEDAVYNDTLYAAPFVGRGAIESHLRDMESAIPPGLVFVLDEMAPSPARVGARWHVETRKGSPVPFSRGASMYSVENVNGTVLISEAWDFVETPFKVAGLVLPLVRAVSTVLNLLPGSKEKDVGVGE